MQYRLWTSDLQGGSASKLFLLSALWEWLAIIIVEMQSTIWTISNNILLMVILYYIINPHCCNDDIILLLQCWWPVNKSQHKH